MADGGAPILSIRGLDVAIHRRDAEPARVVKNVDLDVGAGEIVALVGESGSGKTMIGRSILRLLPPVARIDKGEIRFAGEELAGASEARLRAVRGAQIGMVFQEPMVSLNPALRVGYQMREAIDLHLGLAGGEAHARCVDMLRQVRIADPERCLAAHPHEFSGGMRQRIMLASVFAMRPKLLIADEPTTALDALIQREVMEILVGLAREHGTSVLMVSHDLGMVAQYAHRVHVMRQGEVVESGATQSVLLAPRHEYTRALLEALPARGASALAPPADARPLFEVRALTVEFKRKAAVFWKRAATFAAVDAVDLDIRQGETLALVGESGSGKTTIGRAIARLLEEKDGTIRFEGRSLADLGKDDLLAYRLQTQMVFQDPYSSLDPRMTLGAIVAEGLRHVPGLTRDQRDARAREMLGEVGLCGDFASRYPHELSGGQRQRVCIARAIVAKPRFIVADEPVSALDVTIQRQILELLAGLQRKFGFTTLFISHDLGVVEQIADRVAVMYRGRIVEIGPRDAVFDAPRHPYTLKLLQANPRISRTAAGFQLGTHRSEPQAPPAGYRYYEHDAPTSQPHELVEVSPGHRVACTRDAGRSS